MLLHDPIPRQAVRIRRRERKDQQEIMPREEGDQQISVEVGLR